MRLSFSSFALIACLTPLWAGCTSNEASLGETAPKGVAGVDASISFAHEGTLALAPGQEAQIQIIGKPAAPYAMSIILVGEWLDASVDQTNIVAGDDGVAVVTLRAPNASTSFAVRAKIKDGPTAELPISVSEEGFATLDIKPLYGGDREAREWVARATVGTTCEVLAETFPEDPETWLRGSAEPGEPLQIDLTPVGPNVAVFVRGGHFMWGCVDEADLVAGATAEVEVPIVNAPVDFSQVLLDIDLSYSTEPWGELLEEQRAAMLSLFFAGNAAEPHQVLLDSMQAASCDPNAFGQMAGVENWLTAVDSHLQANAIDLSAVITTLAEAALPLQPPQILGSLSAIEGEPGAATLRLESVGTATPAIMDMPLDYQVGIDVDAQDTARLGGSIFWAPSRYIANAVKQEALFVYPAYDTMAEVLADVAMCNQLVLNNPVACDASQIAALCEAALAEMWSEARNATSENKDVGVISFSASGAAKFDDYALLTGFEGTWIGTSSAGTVETEVSGVVFATEPEPPPQ